MAVVTISRQYAAGGSDVARRVASQLGWTLVDNEFVDLVASRAGLTREEVERREERVSGLIERLSRALALSSPDLYVGSPDATPPTAPPDLNIAQQTEAVIREVVKDSNVVMVGRGSQACLADQEHTLHVFLVAPREVRIQRAVERLGLDRDEAEKAVDETDDGRRRYVKQHYDRTWDHAANYDLVLNTGKLGYDESAEIIVDTVRRRGWTD